MPVSLMNGCSDEYKFNAVLLALFFLWLDIKIATVIRVAIRWSVIRIRIRKAIVSAIVPIAANAKGTNNVGINKVSIAPSIPRCVNKSHIF